MGKNHKRIKILFVAITENEQVRGVERYCIELLKELAKNDFLHITVLHGAWQNYFHELTNENLGLKQLNIRNNKFGRHLFLPIIRKNKKPTVVTVHDIAEYFVKEKYGTVQRTYRRTILPLILRNANAIITVSEFSKKSIVEKFPFAGQMVQRIYNGINHFPVEDDQENFKDYILYFGPIEKSKGIEELIKAFRCIKEIYPDVKLFFIGKPGNALNVLLKEVDSSIEYLGFIPDAKLIDYIKGARVVVYLSKYEGFGMPPLEAMLAGCPVAASNRSAVPEVVGDVGLLVNPDDPATIAAAFEKALTDSAWRQSQQQQALERASRFTWAQSAQIALDAYTATH